MIAQLSETARRMAACSLEIDGRPEIAGAAVVPGHVSEFVYSTLGPASAKAQQREAVIEALEGMIALLGLPATIAGLRA